MSVIVSYIAHRRLERKTNNEHKKIEKMIRERSVKTEIAIGLHKYH